jgi:predicted metal-dependent enzyme (double-stranded beta helix superfamily)
MLKNEKLREFVIGTTRIIEQRQTENETLSALTPLLAQLLSEDDWLPDEYAVPHPQFYQQFLLHADPLERFSIVSFVWGPGQITPIHDHRVWGLLGILRGAEISTSYKRLADGTLQPEPEAYFGPGTIVAVSPTLGDIHSIRNAHADQVSISIHIYGGNIGGVQRSIFSAGGTVQKPFISGYSNTAIPNLWDRSKDETSSASSKLSQKATSRSL